MKTIFIRQRSSKIKRSISLFMVFMLFIAAMVVFTDEAAAAEGDSSAALMMEAIGIISADSSGQYNLGSSLTRAEFAKMLVMASVYKDQVAAASQSTIFRDVAASNWAAPYIKLAASNNLLSGYSDGTFRPGNTVTLEQGVNSALILLGYTQSDFVGAFPYTQMNMYSSLGLSSGITGGIGTLMTKGDAVQLIYNTMKTDLKDGSKTYAEALGYSVNENGEVNYAGIVTDSMNGPYTVTSSNWYNSLGVSSNAVVYKNGTKISVSDVENYDIVYYSNSKTTVWAYNDRVTGIYDKASPSQDVVTSITLSGKTYELESTKAFSALSSTGDLKIGDAVTLLLGRTGNVADAVSSTTVKQETVLYVTESDTTNITGITPSGSEVSYVVDKNTTADPGDVIKITFDSNGNMNISPQSGGTIYGDVDSDLMSIGNRQISNTATILDTYEGAYTAISMSRLNGLTIDSKDVLYYEAKNGYVTNLILENVTGDALQYGIITYAQSTEGDKPSGSYRYDIEGTSYSLNSSDTNFKVSKGPAMFYGPGNDIEKLKNITRSTAKTRSFDGETVEFTNGTEFKTAANVAVYEYKPTSGVYVYQGSISKALEAYKNGKTMTYCYDKNADDGGQIRVIIYQ